MSKVSRAFVSAAAAIAAAVVPFSVVPSAHASVADCEAGYVYSAAHNPNNPVPQITGFVLNANGTVNYALFDEGATVTFVGCNGGAVLNCPNPYPGYWLHDPYNPIPKITGGTVDATGTVLFVLYPAQPQPALTYALCIAVG